MQPLNPDRTTEFTASEILSPQVWAARQQRPQFGLDVTCTKIAVDFQNMRRETVAAVIASRLEMLREAIEG